MQISGWRRRKSSPGRRIGEIGLGFAGAAWIRDGGVAGPALHADPGATGEQRGRGASHGGYCIVSWIQWLERRRIDEAQKRRPHGRRENGGGSAKTAEKGGSAKNKA